MVIHLLTGIFGQSMWSVSLHHLLPSSISSGLYISYPALEIIFAVNVKVFVAYCLGFILIAIALISFIRMLKDNKEDKMKMLL